jgi:uncharacterized protein YpuA (DUF1002 family)
MEKDNRFVATDRFKLITHLFHSKLEMNRHSVILDPSNSVSIKKFKSDNKTLIKKITDNIINEYRYEIGEFQISIACSYFLNLGIVDKSKGNGE